MINNIEEFSDGELIATNPNKLRKVTIALDGSSHTVDIPEAYAVISKAELQAYETGAKRLIEELNRQKASHRQIESLQALLNGARSQVEELQNDMMMLACTVASKERAIQHHQSLRREMRHEITTMRAIMRAPLRAIWSIIRGRAISLEAHLRKQAIADQVRMGESLRKEFSL